MKRYALIGGYGLLGKVLARRLLTHTSDSVLLLGPRLEAARCAAETLGADFGSERVGFGQVDANDPEAVTHAVRGAEWAIFVMPTARNLDTAIEGAVRAGVHCLDLLIGRGREAIWEKYRSEFVRMGLLAVTEAGLQPGLPGVLLRHARQTRPSARELEVASLLRIRIPPELRMPESMVDLVASVTAKPIWFARGKPRLSWWAFLFPYRFVRFGSPFGLQPVSVMELPEVTAFAKAHSDLERVSYLVGGFNAFATWFALPVLYPFVALFDPLFRPLFARVLYYGALRPFARPPYGATLQTRITDVGREETRFEFSHDDEYALTADAVVACLKDLSRRPAPPGIHMMAEVVEPASFLAELLSLGSRMIGDPEFDPRGEMISSAKSQRPSAKGAGSR